MFEPARLTAAIQQALAASATIPADKHLAFVTDYDGHSVQAMLAVRVGDHWMVASHLEWHGGTPDVGIQVHATL